MTMDNFARRTKLLASKKHVRLQKHNEIVTPLRVIDADQGFPEDPTEEIPFPTADEFLALPQKATSFIVEDLIPKSGNVLFRIDPDIDTQMFAIELGVAAAAGRPFPPYGHSSSVTTAMVFKSGSLHRIREQMQLAIHRCGPLGRKRALGQLHLYHPKLEGKQIEYLNSRYDQSDLCNSLPDDCGLLIVYDSAGFLATKNERDPLSYQRFASYLKMLNARGIATAVFFQSARRAYAGFEDDLVMDGWHNIIDLSLWAGAPRESGGGFSVSQRKVSEYETVPSCYQYWYTVIGGKLESGFECSDSSDLMTIKQVEMADRQMRVKEMLARGVQQKTIAEQLGVDAATISRDVGTIKAAVRTVSKAGPNLTTAAPSSAE